jgi:hypothetical protein
MTVSANKILAFSLLHYKTTNPLLAFQTACTLRAFLPQKAKNERSIPPPSRHDLMKSEEKKTASHLIRHPHQDKQKPTK